MVQGLLKNPGLLKENCPAHHPHGGRGINCLYFEVFRLLHSLCLWGKYRYCLEILSKYFGGGVTFFRPVSSLNSYLNA